MKKFILFTLIGVFITIFIANSFAGEADQFVKVENEGLTKTAQRSYILADNGDVLTRLYLENREDIPLKNVPDVVQKAFIAVEDERYYKHNGIDYMGIARAFVANLKHGEIVEGGSTITQQYVKNSIGEKDRTVARKLREAVIAARLEEKYSKEQILEAYLNTIYFGQGAYGIQAAAEVFFGKNAQELTLAEGTLLAGVTKSPKNFSPYINAEAAFKRQSIVLDRMVEQGMITTEEAEAAKKSRPALAPLKKEPLLAPYFVEYVKQQLIKEYGVDTVFKGGLRVHTTLNLRAQRFAERAIATELYYKRDPQAALVSLNTHTGYIMAMVGGRDFESMRYNLAAQGKRQPGSSFKTFVLITALKAGITANDTFNGSSPQAIRISKNRYVKPWIVHNCEGHGGGSMTLRNATVHSVNAAYANITMRVGAQKVADTAQEMGITTPIDPYPSIGIGGLTIGVSPLEMASAYATIANGGVRIKPESVIKITDVNGKIIKETTPDRKRVLSQKVAYQAVDILMGVITNGTATRANIGRPAAGKTGTNQDYRDAWFVGFTPNISTAVWMGHPQAQISMYNVHGRRAYGGVIPATIWHKYMSRTLRGTPVYNFPKAQWPKDSGGYYSAGSSTGTTGSYWSRRAYSSKRKYQKYEDRSTSSTQQQNLQGTQSAPQGTTQVPQTAPQTPSTQKPESYIQSPVTPQTSPAPPSSPQAQPSTPPQAPPNSAR